MYPEQDDGGAAAPAPFVGGARRMMSLEGLIPLVLIIIIAFFLAMRFGVISDSTPVIGPIAAIVSGGGDASNMLVVGATTQEMMNRLNEAETQKLVKVRYLDAPSLERNPKDILAQYDIVMLDQRAEATKEVSLQFGQAIQDWVATGGKLIVVMDSGIRRPQTWDVLGWEATFGDTIPVKCDKQIEGIPSCTKPYFVRAKIYAQDLQHPIMKGIEEFPQKTIGGNPNPYFEANTFDIDAVGKEVAVLQDVYSKRYFPAIVEKSPAIVGKSIYFNYEPERTPGIWQNTLEYLK